MASRQTALDIQRLRQSQGAPVYDQDGDKIGSVNEVFVNEHGGQPEWLDIGTGFFGTHHVLVPLAGATAYEDGIRVNYQKDFVKDAPDVDLDDDYVAPADEQRLYSHYGVTRGTSGSTRSLPEADRYLTDDDAEQQITRSEEELAVGKHDVEQGRLRVHKWVETEHVDVPVELRTEKARVTRERLDQPTGEHAIGDDSIDVTLRKEEPVVHKDVVAKERIGIEKTTETDQRTVSGDVRKERVEVEGDDDDDLRR